MKADFHLHTAFSDGGHAPSELLGAVRRARLQHWAVTDHDTMAGWRALSGEPGLIPGVEVTAERAGREVHIVGLGVEPDHAGFSAFLAGIRVLRHERLRVIIATLGLADRLSVATLAPGAETLTRSHLAQALVRLGFTANIQAAFADHLGDVHQIGRELPPYPSPLAACAAIRAAGGVAILAHPGCYGDQATVEAVLDAGAFDGLEARHPHLTAGFSKTLLAIADRRGLLASCGSDTHVLGHRQPGDDRLPPDRLRPLLRRLGVASNAPRN